METKARLDYLRTEIQNERISYSEIAEIQLLAEHIDQNDTELLQWAGKEEGDHATDTYCTRCRREGTDARDVYFPYSNEFIQLCTDCESEDTAVSPFEFWH